VPSRTFTANAAWLGRACLAHNLAHWTLRAPGTPWAKATVPTFPKRAAGMPARLAHSGRPLRLRARQLKLARRLRARHGHHPPPRRAHLTPAGLDWFLSATTHRQQRPNFTRPLQPGQTRVKDAAHRERETLRANPHRSTRLLHHALGL
jgi:hypothetical protein